MSTWKRQAIEGMAGVFSDKVKKAENKDGEIKELHVPLPGNGFLANHEKGGLSIAEQKGTRSRRKTGPLSYRLSCALARVLVI